MQRLLVRIRPRPAAFAVVLAGFVAEAAAQAPRLVPPKNNDGIDGRPWMTGFVMLIVLALVLVGAFLKARRGHQD